MRGVAVVLAIGLVLAGCTVSRRADGGQAVPASVCDVVTGEVAAGALGVPAGELRDGGCVSSPADRVDMAKVWATSDPVTLTTYVTSSAAVPDDQEVSQCEVGARTRDCFATDDSYAVLLADRVVVTSVGVEPVLALGSDEGRLEAVGEHLADHTIAVAAALSSGRTVPRAVTPTVLAGSTAPKRPSPPPQQPDQLNRGRCVLHANGGNQCSSLDPVVSFLFDSRAGDTSACTFAGELDFGDGSTQPWSIRGRSGLIPIAEHRYGKPGTYSAGTTARVTSGACLAVGAQYAFTLEAPPTPADCENKFDDDRGRAYLYTMLPAGKLRRPDGSTATAFEPGADAGTAFTDEAGVEWELLPFSKSRYHQPPGWSDDEGGDPPFRKFVSGRDSQDGAFEAVLMPDGVRPGMPYSAFPGGPRTYTALNWLVHGPGMPTYNHSHPDDWVGHLAEDVYPHEFDTPDEMADQGRSDDRYVLPAHLVDPAAGDWRTYRERFEELRDLVRDDGLRFDTATGALLGGAAPIPVDQDLRWAAQELTDCAR